jgi:ADP-heptose:LPS heptosyltransferase
MDTAAVMKTLDLVITADTSVAHLAGGLGVKTWVILPFPAEWRWLSNRSDSPWYPTMRLFRKQNGPDWTSVQQELRTALEQELQEL